MGYGRWGSGLLSHLRGPFALVVWSRDARRGLLAQDQLGGRSLFTFVDGERLLFATEVTVLLAMLPRRPDPDEVALAHHLVDHSVPDGRMLFRGIGRIGGGRHLELSDAGRVGRRHWAPRYQPPLREPPADLAARLREELSAAVGDAVAGGRTGALLLSGGLDSSAVAALAAPCEPGLTAITAAFPDEPDLDETPWARRVAEHTGMQLATVPIERRAPFRAAEAYLRAWQLPLPVPGYIIEEPLIAAAYRLEGQRRVRRPGRRRALRRHAVSPRGPSAPPATALGLAIGQEASVAWDSTAVASRLAGLREWRRARRSAARPARARPPSPRCGALRAGLAASRCRTAVPRHPRPVALEAARWAALVGVAGRHADARARNRRPGRLLAPPRAYGRRRGAISVARRGARRTRPPHTTRDSLRSGHVPPPRAPGATRHAACRRALRAGTSATSQRCTTTRFRERTTSSGSGISSISAARPSAPTSTFGDCTETSSIARPPWATEAGGRGRWSSGMSRPQSYGCVVQQSDVPDACHRQPTGLQ